MNASLRFAAGAAALAAAALLAPSPARAQRYPGFDDPRRTPGGYGGYGEPAQQAAAADPYGAYAAQPRAPATRHRDALWIQPLFPLFGPLGGLYNFNLGYSHSFSRGLEFTGEVGLGYFDRRFSGGGSAMFSLQAGVSLLLTGQDRLNGLFITPKVVFGHLPDLRNSSVMLTTLGAGFDLGYQWTRGSFYFGPVLGVTCNVAFPSSGTGGPVYVSGINLGLFRLGVAFGGPDEPSAEAAAQRPREARPAAGEGAEDQGFDLARDTTPRRTAIWFNPAFMAIGPLFGQYNGRVGVTLSVERRISAVIEGAYEVGSEPNNTMFAARINYSRWEGVVGLAFVVAGGRGAEGLRGFFLEPRLVGRATYYQSGMAFAPAFDLGLGFDVGYHVAVGPLYITPVFGFAVMGRALAATNIQRAAQPTNPIASVDWTLLRIGAAF